MRGIFATLSLLLATSAARVLNAPIPGYGIVDIQWEIETKPGGPTVQINGTIEQAVAQLHKINPNFSKDYNLNDATADGGDEHDKRAAQPNDFDVKCFGRWVATVSKWINEGVKYLKGVKGQPTNGPGPGNCGRVSCSYDSAIWWCNDNHASKTLDSFTSIANGAAKIVSSCNRPMGNPFYHFTSGQAFHKDGWNVIVRKDWC
ncbi:hypothetical protein VFPPC_00170 [Pochonia chlamydosporia 170]|uniref:Secreted protein n=1 Tax=Pochonia chlamydosporia 170 TaxID=1380566 RepID=A0A179G437_METCM|nr:hypothetical protein VFPPC_00170 [Pochonia chlamydosporia 170]OAQ72121.1 hypothetical protein VFPPC_00170 [Pochonia chlamydosporia 170]